MMDTMETGTALALPQGKSLEAVFAANGGIDDLIDNLEKSVLSEAPDVTTVKGRKRIASLAFDVAKSKTALDKAGKSLNDERRSAINAVDAERRKAWDRLELLQAKVRAPLDAWEAAEAARVDVLKARVERLRIAHTLLDESATSDHIAALLAKVEATVIDDTWQEYATEAERFRDQAIVTLQHMLESTQKREADAGELARLRAEAAAREEQDRLAAIEVERLAIVAAKEAADLLAVEQAEVKRLADAKAQQERIAQIEREKALAAERAVEVEKERAAFAARQAEERHANELADAKAREEQAAQRERDRLTAEVAAEHAARAKREADTAHRDRIKGEIASAMRSLKATDFEAMADAMMTGKIPHVKVLL